MTLTSQRAEARMPDYTHFTLESVRADSHDMQYFFKASYGQGPPVVSDGYGGWEVTGRPRDIGLTEWKGRNPMAIQIPFMIDNYIESVRRDPDSWDNHAGPGVLVEQQVTSLERLCGIGGSDVPPTFKLFSDGVIPHDHETYPSGQWVVENVDWDADLEIRNTVGNRVRCGGTLTIRQFIKPHVYGRYGIGGRRRRRVAKKGAAGYYQGRTYITKKGDTLPKIAKRKDVYGDATKWRKIARKNNIRDPHKKLKTGTRLGIPFV
jgi:LysM domain